MKFLKDNTVVDIMEAKKIDASIIIDFYRQLDKESEFLAFDEDELNPEIEEFSKYLDKLNQSKTTKIFLAKSKDKLIGMCKMSGHKSKKTIHNCELSLYVLEDYSNKGLGTLLLDYSINYARITQAIKNIYLEVREDNKYAIKLYEKYGFKKVGVMPDKIKSDEKYIAENIYLLQI
jgi:ribosomal protein S18 acetylase RimI-like enzyme